MEFFFVFPRLCQKNIFETSMLCKDCEILSSDSRTDGSNNGSTLYRLEIGKTKIFLRAGQMAELDARRAEVLENATRTIQWQIRAHARNSLNYAELLFNCNLIYEICYHDLSLDYTVKSMDFHSL